MSEELIEELALALVNRDQERFDLPRIESVEDFRLESDAAEYIASARALLPIIRRRELEAGEKVKEAAAALPQERADGWKGVAKRGNNSRIKMPKDSIFTAQSENEVAAIRIRALDVAAIIGDSHD